MRGRRDPKCAGQRPGLNIRQLAQVAKDRPQQFVQPGEGQVRFGLHPGRGQHRHRRGSLACVVQQRRLADPGLTPDDQGPASALAGVVQQLVDRRALGLPPEQPKARKLRPGTRHSAHGSPCGDRRLEPALAGHQPTHRRSGRRSTGDFTDASRRPAG